MDPPQESVQMQKPFDACHSTLVTSRATSYEHVPCSPRTKAERERERERIMDRAPQPRSSPRRSRPMPSAMQVRAICARSARSRRAVEGDVIARAGGALRESNAVVVSIRIHAGAELVDGLDVPARRDTISRAGERARHYVAGTFDSMGRVRGVRVGRWAAVTWSG